MPRDSRLVKRNLLVLPGGVLATLSAVALLYFLAIRAASATCANAHAVLVGGTCYTPTGFLVALFLIGAILVVVGLIVFRGKPSALVDHLYHGTPAHFGLALLSTLVALPLLSYAVILYLERARDTTYVMHVPGSGSPGSMITLHAVLGAVLVVALLAFIPYVALLVAQGQRRRHFLAAAETYEEPPEYPGAPGDSGETVVPMGNPPPQEYVDEAQWPGNAPNEPEVERQAPADPGWAPGAAPVPAAATMPTGAVAVPKRKTAPPVQPAPLVAQGEGCRAITASGLECGDPVGPGGRYCLRHACQGRTATGAPCRNPALEGSSRCRAHSPS